MSIHAYMEAVRGSVEKRSPKMPEHQATVYAIEREVAYHLPSQVIATKDAFAWLDRVCETEGWDTPMVDRIRSTKWAGVANAEGNVIGISGSSTTVLTLAHELAHIVCGERGHNECWRHAFVNIVRDHISVQHASLLHTLYERFQLQSGQWRLTDTSRV